MLRGLFRQVVVDERVRKGCIGVVSPSKEDRVRFWDDLSGEELDVGNVREARREEMEEFDTYGVYETVDVG